MERKEVPLQQKQPNEMWLLEFEMKARYVLLYLMCGKAFGQIP